MSDFLEQFKNDRYKKDVSDRPEVGLTQPKVEPEQAAGKSEEAAAQAKVEPARVRTGPRSEENPQTVPPPARVQPKSARQTGVREVEHEVVIDTSYVRLKVVRYVMVSFTVVVLCVLVFFGYRYFNSIQMLGFEGKNLNEARTWGLKNRIELDIAYAYDTQSLIDTILHQDIEAGTTLQKGSVLSLKVSKGADPNEKITLPDFATLTTSQVREWIQENKLSNISLVQNYDEVIPANGFIRMEFADVSVDESTFTRKDYLIVFMSRGPEPVQAYIQVVSFAGYSRSQVDSWVSSNPVIVTYVDAGSDTVPAGQVISQDVEPSTRVAANTVITLTISIGKGIEVPDFGQTNSLDAAAFVPGLTVTVKTRYSNDVPYGRLVSQSVAAGEIMYGEDKKVEAVYSEGRPFIGQLAGRMENELPAYFFAFNTKGASISYSVAYIDSAMEKGMVVSASRFNEYLWLASGVQVFVSKGNLPPG